MIGHEHRASCKTPEIPRAQKTVSTASRGFAADAVCY